MKLLQVALLFTSMMLAAHVAASSTRKSESTDKTEEFQLEIPEECKGLGFCEDIPNYPKEQADKVISEIPDLGNSLDLPDTRRAGPQEENMELCEFEQKVVYPKAAVDPSGKWHVVLNKDEKPVQGFKVEICKHFNNDDQTSEAESKDLCSGVAVFVSGYQGRCKQKFVYRQMTVLLDDGSRSHRSLKMPSCCSCVSKLISK